MDSGKGIHPAYRRWTRSMRGSRGSQYDAHWQGKVSEDPSLSKVALCLDLCFGPEKVVRVATRPINTEKRSDPTGSLRWEGVIAGFPEIAWAYVPGSGSSEGTVSYTHLRAHET